MAGMNPGPKPKMMTPKRNGHSTAHDALAKTLKGICVPGAVKKCRCGATLKTELDVKLHACVPVKKEGKPRRSIWDTVYV